MLCLVVQIEQKLVLVFHSTDFLSMIQINSKNGNKLLEGKTGLLKRVVGYVVNILSNPALLLDQENMVVDFTIMQKSSWICGEHFEQSCFVVRPGKHGCRLYNHAIPTIFPKHPPHLQTKVAKRKSPKKWLFVGPVPVNEPSPSKVTKYLASDHPYANTKTCPETQVSALKKRVKVLKQKVP